MRQISHETYFNKYTKMLMNPLNKNKSGEDIWLLLEAWYKDQTTEYRCNTYSSFRAQKSKFYKNLR